MSSISDHYNRITKKLPAPPTRVESGMVVSCKYTNRHGKQKNYLVICINSNYKGEFHCFKLNNFTPSDLDKYARSYGTNVKSSINYINVGTPKSFYSKIKGIGGRDYKTFNPIKMTGTQMCSYEFNI